METPEGMSLTPSYKIYQIEPFWDDEYKSLEYVYEPFNDPESVNLWISQGYQAKICGDLCDMRARQPSWNHQIVDFYQSLGWKNIGTAYYRMTSGTVMPTHRDLYKKYISIYGLQGREQDIRRSIIFLEDWKSGHYLEVDGRPFVGWSAGLTIEWVNDTPHMAANLGLEHRYTLQITGHL